MICGTSDNLHFDHEIPEDKSFNISGNLTLSNDVVFAELYKCQLLCRTHHLEKTAKENSGFTHGTIYAWMRIKCPCELCEIAKRAWHDDRNAKRRKSDSPKGPYGRISNHGEVLHYTRGCRCVLCRKANAEHARELRAKNNKLP